jgi:hypothetical protein
MPVFASDNEIGVLSWPYHDHIECGQVRDEPDEHLGNGKLTNLDCYVANEVINH